LRDSPRRTCPSGSRSFERPGPPPASTSERRHLCAPGGQLAKSRPTRNDGSGITRRRRAESRKPNVLRDGGGHHGDERMYVSEGDRQVRPAWARWLVVTLCAIRCPHGCDAMDCPSVAAVSTHRHPLGDLRCGGARRPARGRRDLHRGCLRRPWFVRSVVAPPTWMRVAAPTPRPESDVPLTPANQSLKRMVHRDLRSDLPCWRAWQCTDVVAVAVVNVAGLPLGTEDLPGSSCWSDSCASPANPPA
jgi:hypothetical protein